MKIVYAVGLEGLDRITRTWEVLHHLQEAGHEVFMVGSGRAFGAIEEAHALNFRVLPPRPGFFGDPHEAMLQRNGGLAPRLRQFRPDVVLLDNESFAARIAMEMRLPLLSIDHTHYLARTRLNLTLPSQQLQALVSAKQRIKQRGYRAQRYILPLFFHPENKDKQTTCTLPLLRRNLPEASETLGEQFLAYRWAGLDDTLFNFSELEQSIKVHVPISMRPQRKDQVLWQKQVQDRKLPEEEAQTAEERPQPEEAQSNLDPEALPQDAPEDSAKPMVITHHRRRERVVSKLDHDEALAMLPRSQRHIKYILADQEQWYQDLASCRAVLLDGEHSAIAEAIHFKRPMLVVPREHRIDQWVHAHYVEKMGFGEYHPQLTKVALQGFLQRYERYRENLEAYQAPDGPSFYKTLDKELSTLAEAHQQEANARRGKNPQRGQRGDRGGRRGPGGPSRRQGGQSRRQDNGDRRQRGPRQGRNEGKPDGRGRRGGPGQGHRRPRQDGPGRQGPTQQRNHQTRPHKSRPHDKAETSHDETSSSTK